MDSKYNFPFKTLIWVLFAILFVFIFKSEIQNLISNTEELTAFGIEVKVGKNDADQLESAIQKYESEIASLNNQIDNQQSSINSLVELKKQLERDISNCSEAESSMNLFNAELNRIFISNKSLMKKSDSLKDIKILKRNIKVPKLRK